MQYHIQVIGRPSIYRVYPSGDGRSVVLYWGLVGETSNAIFLHTPQSAAIEINAKEYQVDVPGCFDEARHLIEVERGVAYFVRIVLRHPDLPAPIYSEPVKFRTR